MDLLQLFTTKLKTLNISFCINADESTVVDYKRQLFTTHSVHTDSEQFWFYLQATTLITVIMYMIVV